MLILNISVDLREGGNDGEETILHSMLQHLPFIGGMLVLINKVISYFRTHQSMSVLLDNNIPNNDISYTLDERLGRWWISNTGSFPNGKWEDWAS